MDRNVLRATRLKTSLFMGQLPVFTEIPFFPQDRYTHTDIARHIVIGSITVTIFLITFVAMARNSTNVFPQLFYFPILYTAYFYPRRGLVVAGSCAVAYGIVGSYFVLPDLHAVQFVIGQAILILCVGVAAAYLLKSRGAGTSPALNETDEVRTMVDKGENEKVEFKLASLWSTDLSNEEIAASESPEIRRYKKNASKFIIARSIAGFLNTSGGDLLIGVREDRVSNTIHVPGIAEEYRKLHEKDRNPDGYRRMITDTIVKKYLPDTVDTMGRTIHISFLVLREKTVCRVRIAPSNIPVFVDTGNEELFFIRVDASTRPISGKALSDYILSRFGRKKAG